MSFYVGHGIYLLLIIIFSPRLQEMKELKENGMEVDDVNFIFEESLWACDAHAWSFLKGIIGHNGRYLS